MKINKSRKAQKEKKKHRAGRSEHVTTTIISLQGHVVAIKLLPK